MKTDLRLSSKIINMLLEEFPDLYTNPKNNAKAFAAATFAIGTFIAPMTMRLKNANDKPVPREEALEDLATMGHEMIVHSAQTAFIYLDAKRKERETQQ